MELTLLLLYWCFCYYNGAVQPVSRQCGLNDLLNLSDEQIGDLFWYQSVFCPFLVVFFRFLSHAIKQGTVEIVGICPSFCPPLHLSVSLSLCPSGSFPTIMWPKNHPPLWMMQKSHPLCRSWCLLPNTLLPNILLCWPCPNRLNSPEWFGWLPWIWCKWC